MTLGVQVDPRLSSVLRAVGLLGADGALQSEWFEHPLDALRNCLRDPTQRAALFALLDDVLPPERDAFVDALAAPGASWHPLLDANDYGNVYLTVAADVVGVAAAFGTAGTATPGVHAVVSVPLLTTGPSGVHAIVGTAAAPITFGLRADLGAGASPSAVGLRFAVDDAGVQVAVRLEDGAQVAEFDPTALDAHAVDAVQLLVQAVLAHETSANAAVQDLVRHLPGVLGLGDPALTPLPITDPAAIRPWFASVIGSTAMLTAWFTHVAGLFGSTVTVPALATDPWRATVLDLPGQFQLDLLLSAVGPPTTLQFGAELSTTVDSATVGAVTLAAQALLAAIPLDGSPARALPQASAGVSVPVLGGSIDGGIGWDGTRVVPRLRLVNVTVAGTTHNLDLTDAHAVASDVSQTVLNTLTASIGAAGTGQHVLALLGLVAPLDDPTSPHVLGLDAFTGNLLRAVADNQRAILADATHSWAHLLTELAGLLGLTDTVAGTGTRGDPWRISIVTADPFDVRLAAWDDADATTPAGAHRLRLGVQAATTAAAVPGWELAWSTELLAFDLAPNSATSTRFVGAQDLRLSIPTPPVADVADLLVAADAVTLTAHWQPGTPADIRFGLDNLAVTAGTDTFGPVSITLPGLDLAGADTAALVQTVLGRVWTLFGADQTAAIVSTLFGLSDGLPQLPGDWPTLFSTAGDLETLLTDPLAALLGYARTVLGQLSADGTSFALTALKWLAPLVAGQVPDTDDVLPVDLVTGSGGYDDPWALPIAGADAALLVWLDPAPPVNWRVDPAAAIRAARSGEQLLKAMAPSDLTFSRDPATAGFALDALNTWLAAGDGLVPYASQTAVPSTWTVAAPVAVRHDLAPADPGVVATVAAQLATWNVPSLVVTAATNTDWSALVAAVEPGHDPDARLDLAADLGTVTAVARCYPVRLTAGDAAAQLAQVQQAAARVRTLTGAAQVALVGHGPGGVVCRQAADAGVIGVVTVCGPHNGTTLDPLVDAAQADAARIADQLGTAKVAHLRAILDGGPASAGVLPAADTYTPAAWAGVADPTTAATVGLAIGSQLGGDLIADLAARAAAAVPAPVAALVTHVNAGLRLHLATAAPAAGEGDVALSLRSDLFRIRLADGAAPTRPPQRLTFTAAFARSGGYLIGDAGARTDGTTRAATRVRWVELGAQFDRDPVGGTAVTPLVRLVDAAGPGAYPRLLTPVEILAALVGTTAPITLPAGLDGTAASLAHDALSALHLLGAAGTAVDPAALRAALTTPAAALSAHLGDLLGALAPHVGAVADGSGWRLPLLGGAVGLTITPDPWRVGVAAAATDTGALDGLLSGIKFDASVTLPAFTPAATVAVDVGVLKLGWSSTGLTLAAPPYLPAIRLAPNPDTAAIGAALTAALPRTLVSAVLAVFVAPITGPSVPPLDRLIFEPAAFLRDALGNSTGGFAADKVSALLGAIGDAIHEATGVAAPAVASTSLALPGGLTLSAREPFELRLDGTVPVPLPGSTLTIGLGLRVDDHLTPSPTGALAMSVTLPGTWGTLAFDVAGSDAGLLLGVTPGTQPRISLLPHFDGMGALTEGLTALLPHVLQQIVTELSPPSAWLAKVLDVTAALGIYGPDAQGFEAPARAATLATMLAPGWLAGLANDADQLTSTMAELFQLVPLPLGTITAANGTLDWTVPLPAPAAGTATAAFGWTNGEPTLLVSATGVALGPLAVDTATTGWDGTALNFALTVHLDTDGVLAPVHIALTAGLADGRFAVAALPLGPGTQAEFALTLAPQVSLAATAQAPLDLVEQWALPLAAEVLLRVFAGATGDPLTKPFWTGGPTARTVLAGAGLVPVADPPTLIDPLPDPLTAVLGAIQAAVSGATIHVTDDLQLSLITDPTTHRTGVRLAGTVTIPASTDVNVVVCFGPIDGLSVSDPGVTLWLVGIDGTDVRLTPGLGASGIGVLVDGTAGSPLVDGTLTIGGAGGLIFFNADFTDAHGQPALTVDHLGAGLALQQAFVKLSGQDADSFLAKIIPPQLAAPFDLTVAYADGTLKVSTTLPSTGANIELILPLDIDLTIVKVTELLLGLQIGTGQTAIEAAITAGADLGPIAARVKRVGVIATIGTGAGLRLRPPGEVGLSIDTSTIRLGGFLLVDSEHGRYIGAIDIAVFGKFELSAVGIITTKPDFSLLFIVSMELPVPIALGYGFFFAGAGGLLGLNRGFDINALQSRLRSGAAQSILFPTDVVHHADSIVADLEAVFPLAPGQFVVGPMVMITWSTPPLVTIELGLVLSIGNQPPTIAILGLVRAALPTADEPVLDLKVAFVGAIDVGAQLLRFDASIYDSYIGIGDFKLSLEGDIAVRLSWSSQPGFVLSVGGFHPAYHPPASLQLPAMKRLTLSLLRDNPRLTLTTYFAITANSVQFGARLDFYFGVSGFSIEGTFGFDVLFQVAPFYFDAHVYASLAVKAGGSSILSLDLDFSLKGPTPWIAQGTASFSILFFSVSVAFQKQFGDTLTTSIPLVAVLPALVTELERAANWMGELGAGSTSAVTLVPIDTSDGSVVVEAGGSLTVSQRVVPLATPISRFGTSQPSDVSQITLGALTFGGATTSVVREQFSPGAFGALSDADKLSSPSFELRQGGIRADGGSELRTTYVCPRSARYDLIVMDATGGTPTETRTPRQPQNRAEFEAFALGGAAGKSTQARDRVARLGASSVVAVGSAQERYVVTTTGDLRPRAGDGSIAAPSGVDARGKPVWDDDIALTRVDAQTRAARLGAQFVPVGQGVTR